MKTYVLIVDDEVDFTFFVKKNLEATGQFDVTVCNDATQAVARAKQLRPSLILLDIMMPGIPGEEIATVLQQQPETKAIPIIFLTALVREEETTEKAHMIGGHRFIAKPVKIDELVKMIRKVAA